MKDEYLGDEIAPDGTEMQLAELHAWTDGTETYVAPSAEDALRMQRELGFHEGKQEPIGAWSKEDSERALTIQTQEERGAVTQTVARWIAENGPGFLCSTDW